MLSQELRNKLIAKMKENPKKAIAELEKEPRILEILLKSDNQIDEKENEKIKYVNMTHEMQQRLQQKSKQLKTTQGLLIGAGILLLLSLLEN